MNKTNKQTKALVEKAKSFLNDSVWLNKEEKDELISELYKAAGYRIFSKNHICHGVYFYMTEWQAEAAGYAVRLQNQKVVGGFFHGMPCGRDATHDHVDKQYGLVYGVTIA
jgi:hypothetical protein